MVDLGRHLAAATVRADQAHRTQPQATQLSDQRRVRTREARLDEFAMQHRRLQVPIVFKARRVALSGMRSPKWILKAARAAFQL